MSGPSVIVVHLPPGTSAVQRQHDDSGKPLPAGVIRLDLVTADPAAPEASRPGLWDITKLTDDKPVFMESRCLQEGAPAGTAGAAR